MVDRLGQQGAQQARRPRGVAVEQGAGGRGEDALPGEPQPGRLVEQPGGEVVAAGSGAADVSFTVTATGVPTASISCLEGATPRSSGDSFAIGTHTIECTATNSVGSDSDSFDITVNAANSAPTADAGGPYAIAEGGSLALDGTGSTDPDGDALTYSWDVNGDGIFGDAIGATPVLSWSELQSLGIDDGASAFDVALEVSDGVATDLDSSPLALANTAPSTSGPAAADGELDTPLTLTLAASDPSDGDTAAGLTCLRFTDAQVQRRGDEVVRILREVMRRIG